MYRNQKQNQRFSLVSWIFELGSQARRMRFMGRQRPRAQINWTLFKNLDKQLIDSKEFCIVVGGLARLGFNYFDLNNANVNGQEMDEKEVGQEREWCLNWELFNCMLLHVKDFQSRDIADTLWALATMEYTKENMGLEIKKSIKAAIIRNAGSFNSQDTANTLWALVTMGYTKENMGAWQIEESIKAAINKNVGSFNPQGIVNTLWALAAMGYTKENMGAWKIEGSIMEAISRNVGSFNSQDTANTLWALATMGYKADNISGWRIEGSIKEMTIRNAGSFNSQNTANTLWALATMGYTKENIKAWKIEGSIKAAINKNVGSFKPQEAVNTLWALVKMGYKAENTREWKIEGSIKAAISRNVGSFNSQDTANTLWALATMGYTKENIREWGIEESLKLAITRNARTFNSQNTANMLWALATMGYTKENIKAWKIEGSIMEAISRNVGSFNSKDTAHTLWALAVVESSEADEKTEADEKDVKVDIKTLAINLLQTKQFDLSEFNILDKSQIGAAAIYFDFELPAIDWAASPCLRPSKLQKHISTILSRKLSGKAGIVIQQEKSEVGYFIDICITIENKKFAIEVNGPSHYDSSRNLYPAEKLRKKVLEKLGYEVINIPYFDWDELSDQDSEERYCDRLVQLIISKPNQSASSSSSSSLAKEGISTSFHVNSTSRAVTIMPIATANEHAVLPDKQKPPAKIHEAARCQPESKIPTAEKTTSEAENHVTKAKKKKKKKTRQKKKGESQAIMMKNAANSKNEQSESQKAREEKPQETQKTVILGYATNPQGFFHMTSSRVSSKEEEKKQIDTNQKSICVIS